MLQKEDVENIENKIFIKRYRFNGNYNFFNKDNFYIDKDFETKEECINFQQMKQ